MICILNNLTQDKLYFNAFCSSNVKTDPLIISSHRSKPEMDYSSLRRAQKPYKEKKCLRTKTNFKAEFRQVQFNRPSWKFWLRDHSSWLTPRLCLLPELLEAPRERAPWALGMFRAEHGLRMPHHLVSGLQIPVECGCGAGKVGWLPNTGGNRVSATTTKKETASRAAGVNLSSRYETTQTDERQICTTPSPTCYMHKVNAIATQRNASVLFSFPPISQV